MYLTIQELWLCLVTKFIETPHKISNAIVNYDPRFTCAQTEHFLCYWRDTLGYNMHIKRHSVWPVMSNRFFNQIKRVLIMILNAGCVLCDVQQVMKSKYSRKNHGISWYHNHTVNFREWKKFLECMVMSFAWYFNVREHEWT